MSRMLIIDGNAIINRIYYATLKSEGEPICSNLGNYNSALKTFIPKLTNLSGYDYVVVCCDSSRTDLKRRVLYPEYKGQRTETPFPLRQQLDNLAEICQTIGIISYKQPGIEADDFAASLVKEFVNKVDHIDILTGDHDYFQLINSKTDILLLKNNYESNELFNAERINYAKFVHDYKIPPHSIIDMKAIGGDTSDHYPGIKGISTETAHKLLIKYKSLEKILIDVFSRDENILKEEWKQLGITRPNIKSFKENMNDGFLCKVLATMDTNVPVETNLEKYKYHINLEGLQYISNCLDLNTDNEIDISISGMEL